MPYDARHIEWPAFDRKSGITRLNTDDALLHGTSQGLPINGTINIEAIGTNNDSRVNLTTVYDLGAVTSGHTQLIGAVKFTLASYAAGLAYNRWHMVMGGSIVWVMDGEPGFQSSVGNNASMNQWVDYHFRIKQVAPRWFGARTWGQRLRP